MVCENPCYEFVLACCLDAIKLKAGLTAGTGYLWSIFDKTQGQTYEDTGITDQDGTLTIDITLLPVEDLFNAAAGYFELKIKSINHTPVPLTFGTKKYDCVLISFKEFESASDTHDTIQ